METPKASPVIWVEGSAFDVAELTFRLATKTKSIKAKPLQSLLVDASMLAKFLLDTIEGKQTLKANSMVCIGIGNDAWQQDRKKLLAKYTVTEITEDGWLICVPKPDNAVDAAQVSSGYDDFTLEAQWGERQADGKFLQFGKDGDYICRSQQDPNDVWVVQKAMFESTYEWKLKGL